MNDDKKELIIVICALIASLGFGFLITAAVYMFHPHYRIRENIFTAIFVFAVIGGLASHESLGVSLGMMIGIGIALGTGNFIGVCLLARKESAEAAKWYREAEQGDAQAQFKVGYSYEIGGGVIKDAVEAVKWYTKSAERGNAFAQYKLGFMYYKGNGVLKDPVEAHAWSNLASAGGYEKGRKLLAIIEAKMTPEQKAEATKLAREILERIQAKKKW